MFDTEAYYIDFVAFKQCDSKTAKVPKELFDRLQPHAFSLGAGNYIPGDNPDACAAYDAAAALPDEDLRQQELDSIPPGHYLYVAVC